MKVQHRPPAVPRQATVDHQHGGVRDLPSAHPWFRFPERFNTGVLGIPLKRNSMALANARYNLTRSWFLDMRVNSIQDVARQAIQTPDEMGNRLSAVVDKLSATPFYLPLLEPSAHPGSPGSASRHSSNTCRRCFRTHRDLTRPAGKWTSR